jgi:opacity protein-like surface antigen
VFAISPPHIGTGSLNSAANLTDYGTVRGRAGYIMGRFMPYVMLGLAIGRADFADSARLQYIPVINGVAQPAVDLADGASQSGKIGYGFAAGMGVDVMLTGSIFLRGEYEFIQFTSFGQARGSGIGDTSPGLIQDFDRSVTLNTVRGAVGFKF